MISFPSSEASVNAPASAAVTCDPEHGPDTSVTGWALPALPPPCHPSDLSQTTTRDKCFLHHSFTFSGLNQLVSPFSPSIKVVAVPRFCWLGQSYLLSPCLYSEQRAPALEQGSCLGPKSCCHSGKWCCFLPPIPVFLNAFNISRNTSSGTAQCQAYRWPKEMSSTWLITRKMWCSSVRSFSGGRCTTAPCKGVPNKLPSHFYVLDAYTTQHPDYTFFPCVFDMFGAILAYE